jgi:hypothetical protein
MQLVALLKQGKVKAVMFVTGQQVAFRRIPYG